MKLQRYTFEDALIDWGVKQQSKKAQTAVNVALRLCSQLNWSRGGVLRYNTLDACKQAGISRSTYYDAMPLLREAGFFLLIKGNYHANLPVSATRTDEVSVARTDEGVSVGETDVFATRTDVSAQDNPFSSVLFSDTNDLGWIKENAIEGIQHLFPLDSEASVARVERSWLDKAHQRQEEINAEFRALMGLSA